MAGETSLLNLELTNFSNLDEPASLRDNYPLLNRGMYGYFSWVLGIQTQSSGPQAEWVSHVIDL